MSFWNKKGLMVLCLVFLVLAGCQPVNGFDPLKLFEKEAGVTSYEGSVSLAFDFDVEEAAVTEDSDGFNSYTDYQRNRLEEYRMLNGLQLKLSELKVNTLVGQVSGKGTLSKEKWSIPFAFSIDGERTLVQMEGAKHPIQVKNSAFTNKLPYLFQNVYWMAGTMSASTENGEKERELAKKSLGLLVRNLPNADSLKVEANKEVAVHGAQVTGTQAAFDVTGDQLPGLMRKYARSMTFDDKGLRELADGIYGYLKDLELGDGAYQEWLGDKELSVEGIYGLEKFALSYLSVWGLDDELDTEALKDTRVHLDLLADDQQIVRQANLAIQLKGEHSLRKGVTSGSVRFAMERWNVNGGVQPNVVAGQDAVDLSSLKTSEALMDQVEPSSALDHFLRDELKLTRKQFSIWLMDASILQKMGSRVQESGYMSNTGYISDGIAYGQVRKITEQLGYKVEWEGDTHTVVVKTGKKEIRFTNESSIAVVDGQEVEMGSPVQFLGGAYFVPARFLVEQLGGEVHWSSKRASELYITKD